MVVGGEGAGPEEAKANKNRRNKKCIFVMLHFWNESLLLTSKRKIYELEDKLRAEPPVV